MSIAGLEMNKSVVGRISTRHQPLDRAAGELVGSVFYGKLLSQMRDSKLKGKYGHGGRGEEVFSAQLHGMLAERIGASDKSGLKEAVYKRLVDQQQRMDTQTPGSKDGVKQ